MWCLNSRFERQPSWLRAYKAYEFRSIVKKGLRLIVVQNTDE